MCVRTEPSVKHLRAVVVVVVSIALTAGLAALGWARVGAGVGAFLVTVGVALVHGHGPRRAFAAGAVALVAAVGAQLFFAVVLGSGMPAVRAFASGAMLAPILTMVAAAWAWLDHPRV